MAEALWKEKPVIASAVGGIPLQIAHKYSGILTHSVEGTAFWIKQLSRSPATPGSWASTGKNTSGPTIPSPATSGITSCSSSPYFEKDVVQL